MGRRMLDTSLPSIININHIYLCSVHRPISLNMLFFELLVKIDVFFLTT